MTNTVKIVGAFAVFGECCNYIVITEYKDLNRGLNREI